MHVDKTLESNLVTAPPAADRPLARLLLRCAVITASSLALRRLQMGGGIRCMDLSARFRMSPPPLQQGLPHTVLHSTSRRLTIEPLAALSQESAALHKGLCVPALCPLPQLAPVLKPGLHAWSTPGEVRAGLWLAASLSRANTTHLECDKALLLVLARLHLQHFQLLQQPMARQVTQCRAILCDASYRSNQALGGRARLKA